MIVLASDHAGFTLKNHLRTALERRGESFEDLGPHDERSVDYPDFAHLVAEAIVRDAASVGVLVCGTGLGMCMAANRHAGVRAALCHDAYTAEMARSHNDANVLCLGARVLGTGVAEQILTVFLTTPFAGGRHQRRVQRIETTAATPSEEP